MLTGSTPEGLTTAGLELTVSWSSISWSWLFEGEEWWLESRKLAWRAWMQKAWGSRSCKQRQAKRADRERAWAGKGHSVQKILWGENREITRCWAQVASETIVFPETAGKKAERLLTSQWPEEIALNEGRYKGELGIRAGGLVIVWIVPQEVIRFR